MNRLACALACAAGTLASAGFFAALGQQGAPQVTASDTPRPAPSRPVAAGKTMVTAGLLDWLFGGGTREWSSPRSHPRSEDDGRNEDDAPKRSAATTFRTLCVRLCDGFYFPMSFATTRDRFGQDARRCEQGCPGRSRLFVYRNPGEAVENMVDLEGRPYRELPTAFQHLKQYVASCTCRGNPSDAEALARHQAYAQAPKQQTPDKAAEQQAAAQPQQRAARQSRRARAEWRGRQDHED